MVTQFIQESSYSLPYDLIELSLDVFDKIKLPEKRSKRSEQIIEFSIQVLDNLALALKKNVLVSSESSYKIWFHLVQMIQEKVLFNNLCKKYEAISILAFNVMKRVVLNHPFEVEAKNF